MVVDAFGEETENGFASDPDNDKAAIEIGRTIASGIWCEIFAFAGSPGHEDLATELDWRRERICHRPPCHDYIQSLQT